MIPSLAFTQVSDDQKESAQKITQLISHYSEAREAQDTVLLKRILTEDIDQLVSSGEWRNGLEESIKGMQNSTQSNPGSRRLKVEKKSSFYRKKLPWRTAATLLLHLMGPKETCGVVLF
ncbi:hypothetical protein [Algoriphagus boritolerans]|uniref:hypothetical protein n=1 Tax=Algoriphagus boritolerans TaxID=308111 RepID=UPI000B1D5A3D